MAESDIFIVPQDQVAHTSMVVVTDFEKRRGYQFDAVTRYDTRRTYKPTKHSVPSGSKITDHVTKEPIAFRLVGVLTPYNVLATSGAAAALFGAFGGDTVTDALAAAGESALERTRRNRDQLIQYADEFTLLTVMGGEFQHANMIITSISDPKTVGIGDSYELTVSFREIRVPRSSSTLEPVVSDDAMRAGFRPLKEIAGR